MKPKLLSLLRSTLTALTLSLIAMACAAALILNAGRIAALVGADEKIVSVLSQLHHARLTPPYLMLIPSTLLLMLPAEWKKRSRTLSLLCTLTTILLWLALFAAMLLLTTVNSVPFHTALRILINLIMGGALNAL